MVDTSAGRLRVAEASTSDIPSLREFILEAWKEAGPSAWGWTGATEGQHSGVGFSRASSKASFKPESEDTSG